MANFLSLTLAANTRQFNTDLKAARKQAEDAFGAIRQTAEEAGKGAAIGFGALAAGGVALTTSFLNAAATMQDYKATLEAMYGSADIASEKLAYFVKVAATTPFELGEIVQAGIRIKGLGQEVEKVLPKVINLAAGLKKDLGETALTVAKAVGKSRDALLQLRDTYAITTDQLKEYGAQTNKQNEIINETSEGSRRLKDALFAVIDAKFGDIVGKQADNLSVAFSGLKDSVFQAAAGLGQQIAPAAVKVSRVLTGLINDFNALPDSTKGIIASSVVVVTALSGVVAGMASMAAAAAVILPPLITLAGPAGLGALAVTAAGAVGPAVGLGLAIAGIATSVALLAPVIPEFVDFIKQTSIGTFALNRFKDAADGIKNIGDIKFPNILPSDADKPQVTLREIKNGLTEFTDALDPAKVKTMLFTNALKEMAKASGITDEDPAEVKRQTQLLNFYAKNKDIIGQTAEQLRDKGKTDEDVSKVALGLQAAQVKRNEMILQGEEALALARYKAATAFQPKDKERYGKELADLEKFLQVNKQKAAADEAEIQRLLKIKGELSGTEVLKRLFITKSDEARRTAGEKASAAAKKFNQDQRDGVFASKREELEALKEVQAAANKQRHALKNFDGKLYDELTLDAENFETEKKKIKRAADKEAYDEEFKLIERNRLAGKLTFDGAAEAYKKLGDKFTSGGFFVAGAQAQAYARAEEQTVLAIKQRIDTEQIAIKVNQQLNEQRTVTAEKEIVLGKNVAENEKIVLANIKERLDLEARSIQLNAQKEVLNSDKSPEAIAQITKEAEGELLKARQEATNQTLALEAKIRQYKVETLKIENDLRTATKAGVDAEIDLLQRRLQGGEDVSDALRKELALRQQLDQQIIEGNRQQQLAAADSPERKAILEKRFAQERIAEDKKASLEKKNREDDLKRAEVSRNTKTLELKKAEFQLQKDLVDQQKEGGVDVAAREVQLRQQALDIAIEEVKLRVAAESIGGKSVDDITKTQRIAEIEIQKLRREALKDIQNINKAFKDGTTELEKQRDLLKGIVDELTKLENEDAAAKKNQGGIIGGVEDFAKASKRENDIFDLRSQKRRLEGSINDSERSKKGQLLNQLENERTGRTVGGKTVNETIQDNERQAREETLRLKQEAANEQQRLAGRAAAERRLRSDGVPRTEEEIQRILGINFKAPTAEKETDAKRAAKKAKKGGIPGLEDPALKVGDAASPGTDRILMDILRAITTALNRQGITPPPAVGKPGAKPQNQTPKTKQADAPLSQFGPSGPYPT